MNRLPWFKFFPADWIKGTRELSLQEKAIWIDLLSFMWEAPERGVIKSTWEGIARMTGTPWLDCESIIVGMSQKNILDVTESHGNVTLMSRRMKSQINARESATSRKRLERSRKSHNDVTGEKSEVRSQNVGADAPPPADLFPNENGKKAKKFTKPTPEEVTAYGLEIGFQIDGQRFVDYYEARGWEYKKNSPMKEWRAAVRTWKRRDDENGNQGGHDWRITQ